MFTLDVESRITVVAPDSTIIRELLNPRTPDVNIRYSLAHGTILKGHKTRLHKLKSSSETYYILAGSARILTNDDAVEVGAGTLVYVPPDAVQYVENIGNSDLHYLVICDPAWTSSDVEIYNGMAEPKR